VTTDPLNDSRRRRCDWSDCDKPERARVYATYNADQGENVHALHARYPGVMFWSCEEHLVPLMIADANKSFSTRQWLVVIPDA
jgi:hypothetical protein